jgi:hypothetical protein
LVQARKDSVFLLIPFIYYGHSFAGCKGQDFLNTISTAYAERRLVAENIILPNKV